MLSVALLLSSGCATQVATSPAKTAYVAIASVEMGAVITAIGYMTCRGSNCKPLPSVLAGLAATAGVAAAMTFTTSAQPSEMDWGLLAVPAGFGAALGTYQLIGYVREQQKKKAQAAARRAAGLAELGPEGFRLIEWRRARLATPEAGSLLLDRLGASCVIPEGELFDLQQDAAENKVSLEVTTMPVRDGDPCRLKTDPSAPDARFIELRVERAFTELDRGRAGHRVALWRARFTDEPTAIAFAAALPVDCVVDPAALRERVKAAREADRLRALAPVPGGAITRGQVCAATESREGGFEVLFGWEDPAP